MSDVNVPAAPPPSANEVPIDQSPVTTPPPIGPQAPPAQPDGGDKPAGRPESRREAIQKAFDRANKRNEEAPQRAKPGRGHNQPPEETPDEKTEPPKREVYREGGKFAKAPDQNAENAKNAQTQFARASDQTTLPRQQPGQPGQRRQVPPLPETAPYREPPHRMAEHAKAEWAAAPETVRGEVHRMQKEFDGAYQTLKGDHDTMNSIRHFHDMARQHGTTLDRALTNYVSMEQKLRQDLVGGLDVIVNNLNLKTQDGQKIGLRDVAYHILNMSPDQQRITQTQNAATAASHQIGSLHQEVASLKSMLGQMHNQQQFTYTRSAVDQFADQPGHDRFDELGDLIEQELNVGYDLPTAYRRAELLRPRTHAAQTRNPSAQTRPDDKSISGAPESGPSDGQRREGKKVGRREAIAGAMRHVNGRV